MPRPARYPQVALTPGANFAEPLSGVQLSGWPKWAVLPSSDLNWLMRQLTDWNRDLDASTLRATDVLAATPSRVSVDALAVTPGVGLTLVVSLGGVYYNVLGRIDLTTAPTVYSGPSALVMPASSVRYLVARPQPALGGPVSGSSCAELILSAVHPVAGYATIGEVTSNATNVTGYVTHVSVSGFLEWGKPTTFAGGLRASTGTFTGDLFGTRLQLAGSALGSTLELVAVGNNIGLTATGGGAGDTVTAWATGTGRALWANASLGLGSALFVVGNYSSPVIDATGFVRFAVNNPTSSGLEVKGNGSNVTTMIDVAASGTGIGLYCMGATGGSEAAYFDHLRSTGAPRSVYARTAAAADNTARAILGEGRSAGYGVHGKAVTGAGLFGEVTNNAGVPILVATRTADTTYGFSGGLMFNSAASVNQWRGTCSGFAGVKSLAWYGPGSFLHAYEVTTGPILDSAVFDSAWPTITALASEGNGFYGAALGARIRIRVAFDARCVAAAVSGVDIRLTDETNGGATIVERSGAGSGTTAGWALPSALTDWQRRITFECEYAPPNDGDLSIKLKIKRNTGGQIATRDIVIEFLGTFST